MTDYAEIVLDLNKEPVERATAIVDMLVANDFGGLDRVFSLLLSQIADLQRLVNEQKGQLVKAEENAAAARRDAGHALSRQAVYCGNEIRRPGSADHEGYGFGVPT